MKVLDCKEKIRKVKGQSIQISKKQTKQGKKQICELVMDLRAAQQQSERPSQLQNKILSQLITRSFCCWKNQFYLCNNLGVPFCDGPIALTSIPLSFCDKATQVFNLMSYLRKVKESYMCWIIYNDYELGILNVKLITQFEFQDAWGNLDFNESMAGIFIGKQYYSKARTISTNTEIYKMCNGLSSKTTKQSLYCKNTRSNKNLKSVSMKQKKLHKQEFTTSFTNSNTKKQSQACTHKSKSNSQVLNFNSKSNKSYNNLLNGKKINAKGQLQKETNKSTSSLLNKTQNLSTKKIKLRFC